MKIFFLPRYHFVTVYTLWRQRYTLFFELTIKNRHNKSLTCIIHTFAHSPRHFDRNTGGFSGVYEVEGVGNSVRITRFYTRRRSI